MQLYITATPEQSAHLTGHGFRVSHLAYQIGSDQHLHRRGPASPARGGLLSLNGTEPPSLQAVSQLCRELQRECFNRGFDGVCADFSGESTQDRIDFLQALSVHLQRSRKKLFVSPACGQAVPGATVLINTALSGGTLHALLQDACRSFGPDRVALDVERLHMDFLLPCPSGVGKALERGVFQAMLCAQSPHIFFSHELCAKYFTYQKGGEAHFVLFDDADTLRRKLKLGEQMNLHEAFFLYSETEDLLPGFGCV